MSCKNHLVQRKYVHPSTGGYLFLPVKIGLTKYGRLNSRPLCGNID